MCNKYLRLIFVAAFAVCLGDARLCNVTHIQHRQINNITVAPPITLPASAGKMAARLSTLRALMSNQPCALAAYVIPTADAHNSEYISPSDARREWMTGFTGSAGTAVVTMSKGFVWTDGRYYTQFEKEVDPELWGLMKQSLPETPSIEKWLTVNLKEGDVVGFSPHFMSREQFTPIETALNKARMLFVAVKEDLVDEARVRLQDPPPRRPTNPLITHSLKYSGKKSGDKIADLRKQMKEKKASAIVITALDEVAYILNLRGSDIAYNPVFFSYLIITDGEVVLFWNEGELTPEVQHHLKSEGVELLAKPYRDVESYLKSMARNLSEDGSRHHSIWLSSEANEAIHRAASGQGDLTKTLDLISDVSPVALMKLVKNEVELQGFRSCHIKDSTALVRFFRWLEDSLADGHTVSEVQAGEKLLEFRRLEQDFMGPSFETIAGAGENGAVIHYSASMDGPQRVIRNNDMFLLDSGGQYRDGTTDVTRTRHMGTPTPEQMDAFTRVLKGQMMIGSALFPKGVKGNVLDSFARKSLWDVGLDYAHGTGHGVGHFLNVHEGPSGVSWRPYVHDPGLQPGQILSNEPGFYKVGEYGIRHEDLVEVIAVSKDSQHPRASTLLDDFNGRGVLGFNTLTLVPHQRKCIDTKLLNDFELSYLNGYHKRVLDVIGEELRTRGLDDDLQWLAKECSPIVRA